MTTRNKKKLAALNKENCEEHPRSNLAQNSSAPRSQEDYVTQVSEEIEGRVTKRLSKEFSRTENRILGALARLNDFLMNPLLPGHSGTTPEPSRNALNTSQGTNEDDSQNDPRPEAGLFHGQMTQNSGPEKDCDTNTQLHPEEAKKMTRDRAEKSHYEVSNLLSVGMKVLLLALDKWYGNAQGERRQLNNVIVSSSRTLLPCPVSTKTAPRPNQLRLKTGLVTTLHSNSDESTNRTEKELQYPGVVSPEQKEHDF